MRWMWCLHTIARTYGYIVKTSDSPVDAARELLSAQYRIITATRDAVLSTEDPPDPEHLHDLRVALRRFRAALDLFARPLKGTSARSLDLALDALGDDLGPIRDSNVWVAFLRETAQKDAIRNDPAWPEFYHRQSAADAALEKPLRVILASASVDALIHSLARFLDGELPTRRPMEQHGSVRMFGAQRLLDVFNRIEAYRKTMDYSDTEQMHTLRKLCRKERYWAEFLAPVLKGPSRLLGRRLKKIADALGDAHDMDVHLESLAKSATAVPSSLMADMKSRRIRAGRRFHRAWDTLTAKDFRKDVEQHLRACRKRR